MITLRATATFWFAPENRHLYPGDEFTIPRADFPLYGEVARELVAGSLTPDPEPAASLTEKVKEAVETVVHSVSTAVGAILEPPSDAARFACTHCGQGFKAEKGLTLHLKNAHKDLQ